MINNIEDKGFSIDHIVFAGDITGRQPESVDAQQLFEDILSLLNNCCKSVFYVLGNTDKFFVKPKGKRVKKFADGDIQITNSVIKWIKPSEKYGIFLGGNMYGRPETRHELINGLYITGNPLLLDSNTIYVEHSPYGNPRKLADPSTADKYPDYSLGNHIISEKAFLQVAGHTHKGIFVRNYLNTYFLSTRNMVTGEVKLGGYFIVDIYKDKINPKCYGIDCEIIERDYEYNIIGLGKEKGKWYNKKYAASPGYLYLSNHF